MSSEIIWGNTVIVAAAAPLEFRPGKRGSVAGFRESEELPKKSDALTDTKMVLIEFSDGEAIEIPDKYLQKSLMS